MPTTSCPDSEKLSAYLSGGLPEAELRAVAEHLDACTACRSVVTALAERQGELETRLSQAPSAKALGAGGIPERPGPETDAVTDLGEYRLLEKLGEGGMGAVYKAVHTRLDKIVALKMLPKSHKANQWVVSRFDREMKAIGRLNHPNIVQAYDAREIGRLPLGGPGRLAPGRQQSDRIPRGVRTRRGRMRLGHVLRRQKAGPKKSTNR
jgi:hypothetical protein